MVLHPLLVLGLLNSVKIRRKSSKPSGDGWRERLVASSNVNVIVHLKQMSLHVSLPSEI